MNQIENNKRIAKNTVILYFRMIFTMLVALYTSRIVLNTLGVEDYGIYSVVGGIVIMFSSINTTMATAVQRFMNYEMGRKDPIRLNKVFNTSFIIHLAISIIVLCLLETVGIWFLNSEMNIAPDRINAANWVLQFSIFSFLVNIMIVPYNAAIIANERMKAFAYISIIEVSLRLLIVYCLLLFDYDKLKLYAILIFGVTLILQFIYRYYAKKHFSECKFKWEWDKQLSKEMLSFAGWNMIGVSSTVIRTQGINIVLNIFFDALVNAAMGLANQVKNAVESFTNNFLTAISPQITKSYASGDFPYLTSLIYKGSRYAFYLVLLLTLPLLLETELILKLWLKNVPEYTVIFVQLILVTNMIDVISKTLIQTMFATGKIKNYQIIVGSITLLNLPLAILFYYLGYPPYIAFIIGIIIAIIALFTRLIMLKKIIVIRSFLKNVVLDIICVCAVSLVIPLILYLSLPDNLTSLALITFVSILSVGLSVYSLGLSNNEKKYVHNKIKKYINNKNISQ